ncbi:generic methyltransferase [Thecamonas trahens ATCC 50062]|uniref:Generic methyltransferase n=1 Tax=Thecamonas trahens ATCC 50062 TaxID=461836 RepID=A0A0L0D791_THETB|nr:generic methyltransferase [Thecamonas trahens ATCC 50062]KNC48252.1 generic methyltransferase [Thecamonas trahens ATCC 50062]|eukprot:XP_013758821.1 generic methyltransferase [Thecamonas trahens ATCC 50062]
MFSLLSRHTSAFGVASASGTAARAALAAVRSASAAAAAHMPPSATGEASVDNTAPFATCAPAGMQGNMRFVLCNPREVNSNSRSSYVRSMVGCAPGSVMASSPCFTAASRGLATAANAQAIAASATPARRSSSTPTAGAPPELVHTERSDANAGATSFGSMEVEYMSSWKENLEGESRIAVAPTPTSDWWWTGKAPVAGTPGVGPDGLVTSLPLVDYTTASRQELLDYFDNTWLLTEVLFSSLASEEAFYRPPWHDLRHPLIFYYGHPAALYVNKFRVAGLARDPISPFYEKIFETGVDEMSWDDMHKNVMRWPSVANTLDYRKRVYELVAETIVSSPHFDSLAEAGPASPFWAVVMGFEHERIHLETSSVLIRELPLSLVRRPLTWPVDHPSATQAQPTANPVAGVDFPTNEFVSIKPDGPVVLGRPDSHSGFSWDNEFGSKSIDVADFDVAKHLVTNGEFLDFVRSNGYLEQKYWSPDGWAWRTFRNAKWPTFWRPFGPAGLHEYRLRAVFDEIDMPWAWPADLNYYEVEAYANYIAAATGKPTRAITEPEHAVLRTGLPDASDFVLNPVAGATASSEPDAVAASPNLNLVWGSHTPVDAAPPSAHGVRDVMGNVWQWCYDHFAPLPGFQPHDVYPDFSMPCFDGKHNVIMGGSFAATGNEASRHARFHFRPHFYQHAGARLVQPAHPTAEPVTSCAGCEGPFVGATSPYRVPPPTTVTGAAAAAASAGSAPPAAASAAPPRVAVGSTAGIVDKYEDQIVLDQYLNMHYGTQDDFPAYIDAGTLQFPQRCAALVEGHTLASNPRARALDIGCAVGASAFELARTFNSVTALDISHAFVEAAKYMQEHKALEYKVRREGGVFDSYVARVDNSVDVSRVDFAVGDATALDPATLGTFDGVLIGNVLCRLPDPYLLIDVLPELVNPDGTLVITSPFSWLPQFTPESKWLSAANGSSAKALTDALDSSFELVSSGDIPFVIREHIRKYEFVAAHLGIWRRK